MMKLGRILGYRDIPAPNQMTGFLEDGLFKESNRDTVVEAVNEMVQEYQSHQMSEEDKEAFRQLLQYLAVVSRVLSSDNVIKVFEFADYCKRAYTFILTAFPWALLSESIHRYQYYKVYSIKWCLKETLQDIEKKVQHTSVQLGQHRVLTSSLCCQGLKIVVFFNQIFAVVKLKFFNGPCT